MLDVGHTAWSHSHVGCGRAARGRYRRCDRMPGCARRPAAAARRCRAVAGLRRQPCFSAGRHGVQDIPSVAW